MSLDKAIASGKEHRKPYQGGTVMPESRWLHMVPFKQDTQIQQKNRSNEAGGKGI